MAIPLHEIKVAIEQYENRTMSVWFLFFCVCVCVESGQKKIDKKSSFYDRKKKPRCHFYSPL